MASKSSLALKVIVVVALLGGGAVAALRLTRPVALVLAVKAGEAIDAVPGTVVVRAENFPLRSEIGGVVTRSEIEPGRAFHKGDVLVQLDTRAIDLDIAHDQNDYDAAKNKLMVGSELALELQTAEVALESDERRAAAGALAQTELDRHRNEVAVARQKVKLEAIANDQSLANLKNALAAKLLQKEKMTVRAPFDGVVSEGTLREGALIGTEQIATLIPLARTLEARISEENFAGVKVGQKADVTFLGGIAGHRPGDDYQATVSQILPTADPETQRYIVYLSIPELTPAELVPGKTGEVSITVGRHQAKAIIPRRAISGNQVLVVQDGRVQVRTVKTGFKWLTGIEVVDGLQAGEQVIVDNLDDFSDGESVRTEEPKTAAPYAG